MKYINNEQLQLPPKWETRAKKALAKATQKTDTTQRLSYIENRSDLWRDLAPRLRELSNQKCWYCGKKVSPNSPVDHFRPKGKPNECSHHEGYWWLAFDWRNYRVSCNECNTGSKDYGKLNHFPLVNTDCASCEKLHCIRQFTQNGTFEHEQPTLLDPIKEHDPDLLWFEPDGKVNCATEDNVDTIRVNTSRNIYYWDSSNSDRGLIFVNIKRYIKVINLLYPHKNIQENAEAIEELKSAILDLVKNDAAFDVAAQQYLSEFLAIYPQLEEIFS
jgi:hypothetical protein